MSMPSFEPRIDRWRKIMQDQPLKFPAGSGSRMQPAIQRELPSADDVESQSTEEVLDALATVSRHINDLARELKCLGYFDDDQPWPRAA